MISVVMVQTQKNSEGYVTWPGPSKLRLGSAYAAGGLSGYRTASARDQNSTERCPNAGFVR